MFDPVIDWTLAGIFAVLAVVFFIGKGQKILDAFSGRGSVTKKRSPEEEKKYQRCIGVFLLILAANEAVLAMFAGYGIMVPIVSVIVVLAALVVLVLYMKKNFVD